MNYFLGIDGGQSSTAALIADESGRVLGRGAAGPCNHVAGAEARIKFFAVVGGCLRQAIEDAGLDQDIHFKAAYLGFSGGAEDKEAYARELITAERWRVTHDADIALWGALEGTPGIIAIAGTGSMVYGRDTQGRSARAGGWGYIYGDEGGAFHLVREAVRACLRMEEGWGPPTALYHSLLQSAKHSKANSLLHSLYHQDRSSVARFAPLVTGAAEAGDSEAARIVADAASALAVYVTGVQRQLFSEVTGPVSYVGGVFKSNQFRSRFSECVLRATRSIVSAPRLFPAAGALLGAFSLAGLQVHLTGIDSDAHK